MSFQRVKVLGTGIHLPEKIMTNYDFEKIVETNHQWIFDRTGISERRISSGEAGEFNSDLAMHAANMAIKNSGIDPSEIDFILYATCTRDQPLPNTASLLQRKLGLSNHCACLDIEAACSGFIYGHAIAHSMVQTGVKKNVLVVGSEVLSRFINWADRQSCILFGDGAGAMVIGIDNSKDSPPSPYGAVLEADSTGAELIHVPVGGTNIPLTEENRSQNEHVIKLAGREVFKLATRTMAENSKEALMQAGLTLNDVDWIIPHQANLRIIDAVAKKLEAPREKIIINIEKYGNTSAATIPIAFHEAIADGRIKRGNIVLFTGFGAGVTSGAIVFKF